MEEIIKKILEQAKQEKAFSCLIDLYYQKYEDEDGMNLNAEGKEIWPYFNEQTIPVEERPSGIYCGIRELLVEGYDIDDEYDLFNALMCAVGNADPIMTEFLIRNGADVTKWAEYDESEWWEKIKNWYLEDVDIAIWDAISEKEPDMHLLQALADTAHVLVDVGGLKDYGGLCLDVDENGKIDIHHPRWKY